MKKTGIKIFARAGDLGERADRCWQAIVAANAIEPELFALGDVAVRIEHKGGMTKSAVLDVVKMRHALVRVVDFITREATAAGTVKKTAPTRDLVEDVLAHPAPPLPPLVRITEVPIVAPDGSIQTRPGYHAASRTYYALARGFVVPEVPERPTRQDIEAARAVVFEMLGEFPFVSFSDLAHAVALLMLPMVRELIDGPTPIHVIEKPMVGKGAGLLARCLTYPALGGDLPIGVEADNAEMRKRITAALLTAPLFFVIDNVQKVINSAALSAVVTAPVWKDRFLTRSREVHLPVRCIWIITANNPGATIDNARRMIRIRIDAKVARPDLRTGFRIPDLAGWVKQQRADRPRRARARASVDRRGPPRGIEDARQFRSVVAHDGRHSRSGGHPRLSRQRRGILRGGRRERTNPRVRLGVVRKVRKRARHGCRSRCEPLLRIRRRRHRPRGRPRLVPRGRSIPRQGFVTDLDARHTPSELARSCDRRVHDSARRAQPKKGFALATFFDRGCATR